MVTDIAAGELFGRETIGARGRHRARTDRALSNVGFGLDDLLAAIVTAGADVMPAVHFAGYRLYRQRRVLDKVVRSVHPALGRRFPVLLNCHLRSLLVTFCRAAA
jgi:hypothetical protein